MKGSRYKQCFVCRKSVKKFSELVTLMKESNITKGEFCHKGKCEKTLDKLLEKIYN